MYDYYGRQNEQLTKELKEAKARIKELEADPIERDMAEMKEKKQADEAQQARTGRKMAVLWNGLAAAVSGFGLTASATMGGDNHFLPHTVQAVLFDIGVPLSGVALTAFMIRAVWLFIVMLGEDYIQ